MTWWIAVEDLVLPKQLAGHPALELVNTRSGWSEKYRPEQEYLATLDHLCVLGRLNGLIDDERAERIRRQSAGNHREGDRAVVRARQLRALLREVLVGEPSATDRGQLAAAVKEARSRQKLCIGTSGARWDFHGRPALSEPLDAFLISAGDLLIARPRIGICPGQGCGWLFVNSSGRRRWCQMKVCGNRAKQAAHLARSRS